jgi:hypothetical protein
VATQRVGAAAPRSDHGWACGQTMESMAILEASDQNQALRQGTHDRMDRIPQSPASEPNPLASFAVRTYVEGELRKPGGPWVLCSLCETADVGVPNPIVA